MGIITNSKVEHSSLPTTKSKHLLCTTQPQLLVGEGCQLLALGGMDVNAGGRELCHEQPVTAAGYRVGHPGGVVEFSLKEVFSYWVYEKELNVKCVKCHCFI